MDLRQKNWLPWQNILSSRQIAADIEENQPIKEKSFVLVEESVQFTFPYEANGNHATEPSTVDHVISERHWKSTFDFTEIVKSYGLK